MNKYFYFNYFTVALTNLFVFVPYVLIQNRYNGSVLGIAFGLVIGMILLYLFSKAIEPYPNKDLVQITAEELKQKWFMYIFVFAKSIIATVSAIIVIGGYIVIVSRYLNPDSDLKMILILVLLAIGYAATRNSLSVAYLVEFMMVITVPLVAYIMYKTFTNPVFTWDAVFAVAQHYKKMPNLLTLASATFFFSGFSNLILFINDKDKPYKFKYNWIAPLFTLLIALVTIIVPIGLLGTETSSQYWFIWTVAADATEISYGFIERLIFIYIIVLLNIAITYTVSTLSQVIHVCKGAVRATSNKISPKTISKLDYYIYGVIALIIFACVNLNYDFLYKELALRYLLFHFFIEVILTSMFFILVKWKGAANNNDSSSTKN